MQSKNNSQPKGQSRHFARMMAFQFLYSQGFHEARSAQAVEEAFRALPRQESAGEIECEGFVWELISGVSENLPKLDEVIEQFATNWRIDRLGRVELGLLRLATFEIIYRSDIPAKVTINEALELNKQFGEEKSRAFLNGILDAVAAAKEKGTL